MDSGTLTMAARWNTNPRPAGPAGAGPVEDGTGDEFILQPREIALEARGQVVQHPHLRVTLKMFDEMAAMKPAPPVIRMFMLGSSWAAGGEIRPRCRARRPHSFSVISRRETMADRRSITATR